MKFNSLSVTYHTNKVRECVAFYEKYFSTRITFDSEWYVVIRFDSIGITPLELSFQDTSVLNRDIFAGGMSINIEVKDVDACYNEIKDKGIVFFEDVTDHEWGDRAFSIQDPIGNIVYVFSVREISERYKEAVKESEIVQSVDKIEILNKICFTELVYGRINKKLKSNFSKSGIEKMIFDTIKETEEADFKRIGKNIYVANREKNIKITINSNTYRVITADKVEEPDK